ncbi:MAG TPA: glycosyltransferase family 4 protein [Anaerolineales bacterium]|nr:glycosyltransferase family 4 protein [Anaerolineales bacterium]
MRILVLVHEFPPVGGGGGRVAEDICSNLARRGHEVKVLTTHIKGLPYKEERYGFQIIRFGSLRTQPYRASFLSMAAYVLAGLWAGRRLIGSFKPDVIHAHFAVPAGALAWILSRLSGIPYVLTVHLGDVPGGVPEKTDEWFRWVYPFTPRIWRNASEIVAVSEFTRQLALKAYNENIQVVPNGVDVRILMPERISLNDPPRIVFAGRFMEQKNPLQFVQTLNDLKELKWQCVMIGDGPLMPDVKCAIEDHGLQDRVQLTGWLDPQDVLKWFDKSDILFMPSRSEGMPVVGVQALAKGLAIVASRVGGFVDLVDDDKNGYLIQEMDATTFSHSLASLLSDSQRLLAFRIASLEKARSFELDQIVKEYENIFLRVKHD